MIISVLPKNLENQSIVKVEKGLNCIDFLPTGGEFWQTGIYLQLLSKCK